VVGFRSGHGGRATRVTMGMLVSWGKDGNTRRNQAEKFRCLPRWCGILSYHGRRLSEEEM
jgi:hypothetical protein